MRIIKRVAAAFIIFVICSALAVFAIYAEVEKIGKSRCTTEEKIAGADCIIVPGAGVLGNKVSSVLAKRLDKALEIYNAGSVKKIIVSGDHGSSYYDEVNAMRSYLTERGVPAEDIFMDHAGFSTYDTVYRANAVFLVKNAVIVTQRRHLWRALYISYALGLDYVGVAADEVNSTNTIAQSIREIPACVKAFIQCRIMHSKPQYLGDTIPVMSESGLVTEG